MSGLEGSISKISVVFDKETDNRDIRQGLKNCINYENKISTAEREAEAEKIARTNAKAESLDSLLDNIREDMGEMPDTEKEERTNEER